jgi:hypothetical protein
MIGTIQKCTINMTTNAMPMLATNAPHSGILSKYRTATVWKHNVLLTHTFKYQSGLLCT